MDFARRQLEKYGWSTGKGLGKHENGIAQALKPKLKRSVTGIGHDAAAEFNEHWWSALYDKAAKNVEVEDKHGKTKKIKTVDKEDFTITNNTWRINKKSKSKPDDSEYSEYFVRKAVLTNKETKIDHLSESESEDDEKKKDVFKMTDEELFAACEGRTAHKGARHGLKAVGKLARIAQQEQILLMQSKYEGYSHAKKMKQKNEDVVEDISLEDNKIDISTNNKKKKRKRCISIEGTQTKHEMAKSVEVSLPLESLKCKNGDTIAVQEYDTNRKSRKPKTIAFDELCLEHNSVREIKKKKKRNIEEIPLQEENDIKAIVECSDVGTSDEVPRKKRKKKRYTNED